MPSIRMTNIDATALLSVIYKLNNTPLKYDSALALADVLLQLEDAIKKYEAARNLLFQSVGAKRGATGYQIPMNNLPAQFWDDLERLDKGEIEISVSQIDLPKDKEYPPILLAKLKAALI